MLVVNGTIRNNENFFSGIKFGMVFSRDGFAEKIQKEELLVTLVFDLLAQVEDGYKKE